MKRLAASAPLLLVLLSGCKSCNSGDASADASVDAPADAFTFDAAAARAAYVDGGGARTPWQAVPGATANLLPNMGIGERFQVEAKSRPPAVKPATVEAIYAALEKGGVHVTTQAQHLGQPFGARYCVGAEAHEEADAASPKKLYFSVCEFMSDELAVMSRDYIGPLSALAVDRTVHANKQTTLVIRLAGKTPDTEALQAKAFAIYDKL